MNRKQSALEFVNLVKVDCNGRECRESMPRWMAELAIEYILLEEPEVACAKIEPIYIDRQAPYPVKQATPEQARRTALYLAGYLPTRVAG